jgi:hypothetical protein
VRPKRILAWPAVPLVVACSAAPAPSAPEPPPPVAVSPTPVRPPTPADYETFAASVEGIDAARLPRRQDAAFARLFDPAAVDRLHEQLPDVEERLGAELRVAKALSRALKAYGAAGVELVPEALVMTRFTLHLHRSQLASVDDFWATLAPVDDRLRVRLDGNEQMREGLAGLLLSALLLVTTVDYPDLEHALAEQLRRDVQPLLRHVRPEHRRIVLDALARTIARRHGDPVAAELERAAAVADLPDLRLTPRGIEDAGGATLVPRAPDPAKGFDASFKRHGANDLWLEPVVEFGRRHHLANGTRYALVEVDPTTGYRELIEVVYSLSMGDMRTCHVREPASGRELVTHPPPRQRDVPGSLYVVLLVVAEGIAVKTAFGHVAPGCQGYGTGVTVPLRDGVHDFTALHACLLGLKTLAPNDWGATLTANPDTPMATMMELAETAAGAPTDPLFPMISFGIAR